MKKVLSLILSISLCAIVITGCESAHLTAKDFDTRLRNMGTTMKVEELVDISSGIIGANKKDFEELSGWYADKDVLDTDILVLKTRLDSRSVTVTLTLEKNRVDRVGYSYDVVGPLDFINYTAFNAWLGEPNSVSTGNYPDSVKHDNMDDAVLVIATALENKEREYLSIFWYAASSYGDEARVQYSFSYDNVAGMGDLCSESVSISNIG